MDTKRQLKTSIGVWRGVAAKYELKGVGHECEVGFVRAWSENGFRAREMESRKIEVLHRRKHARWNQMRV